MDNNGQPTPADEQVEQRIPIPQELLALIGAKELMNSKLQSENARLREANWLLGQRLAQYEGEPGQQIVAEAEAEPSQESESNENGRKPPAAVAGARRSAKAKPKPRSKRDRR